MLTSIDLSNFITSNVINMKSMFRNCRQLTSIDLSSFSTLLVEDMMTMFEGCINLDYINLKNFNEINYPATTGMFSQTPNNIIYCIYNNELTPKIKVTLEEKECIIKDCDIYWKENYENMIENKKKDINVIHNTCIIKLL